MQYKCHSYWASHRISLPARNRQHHWCKHVSIDGENARFHHRYPQPPHKLGNGVRSPNAAPINDGTGVCALRAPPHERIGKQYIAVVTARRLLTRTCSPHPLSAQAVTVGFRCGTIDPRTRFLFTRWWSVSGVGRPTLQHRDILGGSIQCFLVIAAGVHSIFPLRWSRQE